MQSIYKYLLWFSLVLFVICSFLYFTGETVILGPALILFFLSLSMAFRGYKNVKGFSFAMLIFACVTLAMYYPDWFLTWGDFELQSLIVPLLQIIMFGMGTAMSLKDFGAVVKNPKAVFIGLACQFTIMPVIGLLVTIFFNFPPEVAAGVILIGSSPSGLASNVMAYIGKANLALSVTLTTVATLLAPFLTPVLMKLFGDQLVPIDFWDMMWGIVKITILPIIAGLVFNKLAHGKTAWLDKAMPLLSMGGIALILTIITATGRDNLLTMGVLLIVAGFIHNMSGYFLGYWACRLLGLDERSCRTISFEVGMQNAGLASGLALLMGKVGTVGLAPAVFGPMMNVTGSSLATWWRDKPIKGEEEEKES